MSVRECITDILNITSDKASFPLTPLSVDQLFERALPLCIMDLDDSEPDLGQWETSAIHLIREIYTIMISLLVRPNCVFANLGKESLTKLGTYIVQ